MKRLALPLLLIVLVVAGHSLAAFMVPARLPPIAEAVGKVLVLLAIYWGLLRAVDVGIGALSTEPFAHNQPERLALLPLFSKAAKITLTVLAAIEILQSLGYSAASLFAGLGIGGLAIALAAQKTVENLVGSVILTIDRPFRPGDTVQVGSGAEMVLGTVESVGLRSTRIRTVQRTVVTLPNGRLADMRIESYAPRDRSRLDFVLSIAQTTTSDVVRAVLCDLDAYLRALPELSGDPAVFLSALTRDSLDVSVGLALSTTDDNRFFALRQDIFLHAMKIVESNGTKLAAPVRDVRLPAA